MSRHAYTTVSIIVYINLYSALLVEPPNAINDL